MTTSLARRPETGGGSPPGRPGRPGRGEIPAPGHGRGTAAQAGAALGMLVGPWVALSPCFVLLPSRCPPPTARRVPSPGTLGHFQARFPQVTCMSRRCELDFIVS
jgi:hypothetical protein